MPPRASSIRPLSRIAKLLREQRSLPHRQPPSRTLTTAPQSSPDTFTPSQAFPSSRRPPVTLPDRSRPLRSPHRILTDRQIAYTNVIKTYPPPPSTANTYTAPITDFNAAQVSLLDPSGTRTALFSPNNPDRIRVGDMVHCTLKDSPPFNGIIMVLKHRAQDTAILLRNRLLPPENTGVEMWIKIYSPNLKSVELVKRAEEWTRRGKRARRAKLYYLREGKKHPLPNVEGEVRAYLKRRRQILGKGSESGGKGGGL